MAHLQPFKTVMVVDGQQIQVLVSFGNHVFTDEKNNGPCLFKKEGRYFSRERWEESLNLPRMIEDNFIAAYAIAYNNRKKNETYYYTEANDYKIFFDVRKPPNTNNELRLKIISSYLIDTWGSLPKGNPVKTSYIMSLRLKGTTYFKEKKQKKHQ